MTNKHETPEVLKTKLKEEVALISKLKADLQTAEQRLQDVVGAYILGAGLPQQGIRFDESFDLLYESEGETEEFEVQEEEPEMVVTKSNVQKPKIR
jgi:hypothetical protein